MESEIRVARSEEKKGQRIFSASPLPNGKTRPSHAISTYSVLPPRNKIMPDKNSQLKKSHVRHSQSTHVKKSKQKSMMRYKKLDMTTGQGFYSDNPLKQHKRRQARRKVRDELSSSQQNLKKFYDKVESCQHEFYVSCHTLQFGQAIDVAVKILNYTVDFNLPQQLLRSIKLLADLNLQTDNVNQAFFYYNQTREGALLINHSMLLVQSLLGMAECCSRCGIEKEGIKVLKKALEYTWINHLDELELRIYDEIGKLHYHMGELQKAKQYHVRHINSITQSPYSALRLLSAQRVAKSEQINLEIKYKQVSLLMLIHLKVPIKNLEELPLPFIPEPQYDPVRSHFDINSKYFVGQDVNPAVKKLLNENWFFKEQIQDPSLPEQKQVPKNNKFAFLDFQLNKQLKRLQGGVMRPRKKINMRNQFPVKQSLEQKIARKIKEPPLEEDWYEKILRQINRDHRNKLLNVRDAVRIRGFNRKVIPPVETVKDLFNGLFERWKAFKTKNGSTFYL